MLLNLLGQIPADESSGGVSEDGAYGTKACFAQIDPRQAEALILARKNAQLWKVEHMCDLARNEAVGLACGWVSVS